MIGIYKITNKINGKSYIGQSTDIAKRWSHHLTIAYNDKYSAYQWYIHHALKKYGKENFTFEVLEECTEEQLNEREIYWIAYFDTYNNGYNLTEGGNSSKNLGIQIDQYDLMGNFIQSFENITKASKSLDIGIGNIITCLKKRSQSAGNYIWRYHGEPAPDPYVNTVKDNHKWSSSKKAVAQYTKDGQYITTYLSAHDAARAIGKQNSNHISECCLGKRKTAGGYIWKYDED